MRDRAALNPDTIEVADVIRTLRRQWRAVVGFIVLGVVGALAVIVFAPRRFDGKSTVLVRTSGQSGGSILNRMTGSNDLLGGLGALSGASGIETELQVLRSNALAGQVVDSLRLQFAVREPAGIPPTAIVQAYSLAPSFGPRKYRFERQASGNYAVAG